MAALHMALAEAVAGHGRLILLAGEPGIGKTRTVHELAAAAAQLQVQVLQGRCYAGEGAPPFWPWVQIIRSYIASCAPETLLAEMGVGAAAIAQVLTEVRLRLPDLPVPPTLAPAEERFRFFDSLTTCLKNAAHRQPLVLIFDDLHWSDKPSLLLLQFLARELQAARLLFVGTYRDVALDRQHPLTPILGDLAHLPGYQCLFLQGLSQSEVARFIELTVGVPPAEAVVAPLHRQTEGNPFFLTEIVRLLVMEGGPAALHAPLSSRLVLPQGVRDAIERRLQTLAAPCQRLLTLASVIGRTFDLETLARVSGMARDQLLPLLDRAVAAQVITESRRALGRYRFAHALMRETLYTNLPTAQRIQTHRQIGAMLEERFGLHATPRPLPPPGQSLTTGAEPVLAQLAYHFFEAARGGDDGEKAMRYAVQAGEQATALLAYEEAAAQYERALQTLECVQPTDARRRCELLLALCGAQTKAGDVLQARQTLLRAANTARHVGAPALLARAALGLETVGVEVGLVDQPLVTLLEEALEALGDGDSALRARVLARLAQELYFSASAVARRAMLSQQAVAMAQRVGDPTALAAALDSRRLDLWGPGDVQDRLAMATETIRLAEAAGDRERAMHCRNDRITDLLELGDMPAVEVEIDTYVRLAENLRQPRYVWSGLTFRGMRLLMEGRFADGQRLIEEAWALGQSVQRHIATNVYTAQLFSLHREQGRLQELEGAIKDFVAQAPTMPAWRSALASLYSELGRMAEARHEFERLAANNFADLPRDENWLIGVTLLAEVCAFLTDARRAALLYDLLLPYTGHNVVIGDAAACNGAVARPLGLLAATLRRWEEAARHFAAALAMNQRLGASPFVARTQCEYAAVLLTRSRPGDAAPARELLDAALYTAQKLGMQGLETRVRALQQQGPHELAPAPLPVSTAAPQEARQGDNVFRQDGDYWTLSYQETMCRLKDIRGLHYIARLLHAPGQEFYALDLVTTLGAGQRLAVTPEAVPDLVMPPQHDVGGLLDASAKAAYKRRLHDLQAELADAQRCHDPARVAKARIELEWLTDELAAAVGLGGRNRKVASGAERARSTVTKSIKAAVRKICQHHPALGHHLTTHIKTGMFCQYL
ncbi:MAG TPA: AAA family ATPase, partial [Candidatus Tectomicrobia bacterium]